MGVFSGGGGTFHIIDSSISNKHAAGAHAGWYPAYGILEFCNPGASYGCDFSIEVTNTDFTDNDVGIGIGSAFAGYQPQNGTVDITGCTFTGNDKGLWRHSGTANNGGAVTINFSNIHGNAEFGVDNELDQVDAENNWWGDASGPHHPTANPTGTGNAVSDNVDFIPWLGEPYAPTKSVGTATGTGTADFTPDAGALEGLTAVDEATLPPEGKPDLVFPHGFFSFRIMGLTPGQTVVVTIELPAPMPVGTQYWKYHVPEGWIQIPMGDDDGDNVITITLVDGGLGDDDGVANGVIVDQGGPGYPPPIPVGGYIVPVSRFELLAPYVGLAALMAVAVAAVVTSSLASKR